MRNYDDWITAYLEATDNTEPCKLYRMWTAISTIAAVLQRKCWVMWERQTFPNLYCVLVGPPAARKGTAMAPAVAMLRQSGIHLAAESLTMASLIKVLKRSYSGVETSDTGIIKPHSSLTVFNEELTVLIGYQDKSLVDILCNMYDCPDPWKKETTTQGVFEIPATWLNILGATTPDNLVQSLPVNVVGGGWFSRCIVVYAKERGQTVTLPFLRKVDGQWVSTSVITDPEDDLHKSLFNDLQYIKMLSGKFIHHEDWIECWVKWYPTQDVRQFHSTPLEYYLGRRQLQVLKLSMISCASRRDGDKLITKYDFERALGWLEETEPIMLDAFSGFGKSDTAALTHKVMGLIMTRGHMHVSELMDIFWRDADKDNLLGILHTIGTMREYEFDQGKGLVVYNKNKS